MSVDDAYKIHYLYLKEVSLQSSANNHSLDDKKEFIRLLSLLDCIESSQMNNQDSELSEMKVYIRIREDFIWVPILEIVQCENHA